MRRHKSLWFGFTTAMVGLCLLSLGLASQQPADPPQPVEDSMHEFMEYVFQPTYGRLQAAMAKPEKDDAAWKVIKSDALILAEGGNLLLLRKAPEQEQEWRELSLAVRSDGGKLYQAARQKDSAAAGKHYRAMLDNCNTCHQVFAEGKHQLEP